ncbi:MAG: hypothetical protein PHE02_04490 [Lachnospiraceae bacterium]|nr:hypothetical protein [Lachnospiraceae bacterium]
MFSEDSVEKRICLILTGMIIALGILTANIGTHTMPSSMQLASGAQNIAEEAVVIFEHVNSEEVSTTGDSNPILSETLRANQARNSQMVQFIHLLLVYLSTVFLFFYLLATTFILFLAQGRGVIINFIHEKDGQKDKLHYKFA